MRRYGIGLQLVLLVCSGVASGYIWHAALTSKRNPIRFVFIGPPYEQTQLAPPPPGRPTLTPARTNNRKRHVRAEVTSSSHSRHETLAHAAPQQRSSESQLASASAGASEAATRTPAAHATRPAHPARPPVKQRKPAPASPPPHPAAPPPPPVSPPPPPPPSAPKQIQAPTTKSTRPGWGHGDKNHDHTGPAHGASADRGQSSEHDRDQTKKPKPGK